MNANVNETANALATVEVFGIETLDKAVQDAVTHMSGTKSLALDFLHIQEIASSTDRLKTYKFPALVERIFRGQYDGSTAYKYAQCARMFSNQPDIWDFFSISKLQILMNCENSTAKAEKKSAYKFLVWYATTLNEAQNNRVRDWEKENEEILSQIETAPNEATANLWREKLTPCPEYGIDEPEKGTDARKEFDELMFERARKLLTVVTDVILRDLVKIYRGSDVLTLNTATGKPEKVENPKKPEKPSEKPSDEPVEKTAEELKADAHAALLAYVSTFTASGEKVPKTLKSALDLLEGGVK